MIDKEKAAEDLAHFLIRNGLLGVKLKGETLSYPLANGTIVIVSLSLKPYTEEADPL